MEQNIAKSRKSRESRTTENYVQVQGVLSEGFGMLPRKVMIDKRELMTGTAKLIYAYLASFGGGGNTALPSAIIMCEDLRITKQELVEHLEGLIVYNYIDVVWSKAPGADGLYDILTMELL